MPFNTISKNFIEDETTPWKPVEKGIERKVMAYGEDLMIVKVRFELGAIGSKHKHVHTQATLIESGVFEVFINGENKVLKKGDVFYIPSDVLHGVLCIEDGILIDVFNPARKDFL